MQQYSLEGFLQENKNILKIFRSTALHTQIMQNMTPKASGSGSCLSDSEESTNLTVVLLAHNRVLFGQTAHHESLVRQSSLGLRRQYSLRYEL